MKAKVTRKGTDTLSCKELTASVKNAADATPVIVFDSQGNAFQVQWAKVEKTEEYGTIILIELGRMIN